MSHNIYKEKAVNCVLKRRLTVVGPFSRNKSHIMKFPLTLIFRHNFVKISLLMTFISTSISLKTSNIYENKSQAFERSDCTITVHNDLYYNEPKI